MYSTIFLITACQKEVSVIPYDPGTPPISLGSYLVTDHILGLERNYEIGVHWLRDRQPDYIKLCNFANLKIDAIAHVVDQDKLVLTPQKFSTDSLPFEIYQGTGILSSNSFELTYWGNDGQKNFQDKMIAYLQ